MKSDRISAKKIIPPFGDGPFVLAGGAGAIEVECPRCKSENCLWEYFYRTGEELVSCPDCGYYLCLFLKRGNDGNFILKDKTKEITLANIVSSEILIDKPYGTYEIDNISGYWECEILETKKDYEIFVSKIDSKTIHKHNINKVTVSRFVDGKIIKEVIFPKTKLIVSGIVKSATSLETGK